jgi:hypothetical protein
MKKASIVFAGCIFLIVSTAQEARSSLLPGSIITAASLSHDDVVAAISQATDGDTVKIPAGQAVWTEGISITKSITVQGSGVSDTIVTFVTTSQIAPILYLTDALSARTQRITGITFVASNNRLGIGVLCKGNRIPYTTQRRIDHCKFVNLHCGAYIQDSYGVSDHNVYTGCGFAWRHAGNRGAQTWAFYGSLTGFDSPFFFFHENEMVTLIGDSSAADTGDAQNYVVRKSTFRCLPGARAFPMFDAHGDYGNNGNQWGNIAVEIYDNTFTFDAGAVGTPLLTLRGGKALVFNNTVTGNGSANVQFREESYEASYYGVWPLPATNVVHDTYVWNNRANGLVALPYVYNDRGQPNASSVIRLGQEYFTTAPKPLRVPPYPHPLAVANGVESSALLNMSTRGLIQTGDRVLIAGFVIAGNTQKAVMVRAIGPSIALSTALSDPMLELHDSTGKLIAINDNWKTSQQEQIAASGLAPTDSREAALITTLSPGSYTAVVRGAGSATGIGLVEIYDLDNSRGLPQLINISARGNVLTGDNVLIGGFIVTGGTLSKTVAIRASGPSLTSRGVTGALPDPNLKLYDGNGTLIAANDDWKTSQQAEITATGLALANDRDSAVLATLPPGPYTAITAGKNGATGVGLVEIYSID